ncbi:hypothetical protein ACMYR3_04960 [Ampullimonas aquatilis]|uniref:hypothetical protein n=1 Tax=Ampullimonas aquatilis TaxID=1341549 RepID=UPI003C73B318
MQKPGYLMIFILLGGCTTAHWNKPGMTSAQYDMDREQCEATAKQDFPAKLTAMSDGPCVSAPSYRCPYRGDPAAYTMYQGIRDENSDKRLLALNACLKEKGYSLTIDH